MQDISKHFLVKVDGSLCQLIDEDLFGDAFPGQGEGELADLFFIEAGKSGDLMSVMIKKGDAEQTFQVVIVVNTVVAHLTLGTKQLITLFPDADGVRFDTAKVFDIPYGKSIHWRKTKGFSGISAGKNQPWRCNIVTYPTTYEVPPLLDVLAKLSGSMFWGDDYYYKFARNHKKQRNVDSSVAGLGAYSVTYPLITLRRIV